MNSEWEGHEIEAVECTPPSLLQPVGVWQTRDGRELLIEEMSTKHLASAIELFERAGWGEHRKIEELRNELAQRHP